MWRKIIPAAAISVLLAGPAFAQSVSLIPMPGEEHKSREEIERERVIERDYNAAASKIPDKKPSSTDPWGNVRAAPAKPTASKQRSQ